MMSETHLVNFPVIDLKQILVPLPECTSVYLGPLSSEIIQKMKESEFDYATVLSSENPSAGVIGIISRLRLERLLDERHMLTQEDPEILKGDDAEITVCVSLNILLQKMAKRPGWLVVHEGEAGGNSHNIGICGLVTMADLNKHPVRIPLYEAFAELEIALASFILKSTADPDEWINRLNEESQARILGYWELSRRRNVNVGPVAGAMLSDLLNVVARDGAMLSKLGFKSRQSFSDATGNLPTIRNQVMHPVRPLIYDAKGCIYLEDAIKIGIILTERARELNQQGRKQ
jgi:hypothetical protein